MINTIKKAIHRIVWRTDNGWKANENDVEAVNFIIDFINKQQKKQLNDFQLFAKLYILVYGQYLRRYRTTVFDKIPEIELHKLLDRPLDNFIEDFKNELNMSELYILSEDLGLTTKHPATRTKDEKEKDSIILEQLTKEETDVIFGHVWDYETVKENLETQINNVINLLNK